MIVMALVMPSSAVLKTRTHGQSIAMRARGIGLANTV
jgi:hypothetical protein